MANYELTIGEDVYESEDPFTPSETGWVQSDGTYISGIEGTQVYVGTETADPTMYEKHFKFKYPKVSKHKFMMMFSLAEIAAINTSEDVMVQLLFALVNGTDMVDINLKNVRDGIDYLVSSGVIPEDRRANILQGIVYSG